MKRVLFLLFFLQVSLLLVAQNYQTIVSNRIISFIGNDNVVESIRIDSVFYQGDSVLYPFYNIQDIDYYCILPFSYSWIGKKIIIREDGYNCFINSENDTVKINTFAQLNESWLAYKVSDTISIIATVTRHDTLSFLGQLDSVKTISFTAYDQDMNSIFHPVNNMTVMISKNFGLLKTLNFSLLSENSVFSSALRSYNLIGMSSPEIGIVNLIWKDIYDFDIGDEIHIVYKNYGPGISFINTVQKIKYTYLEKKVLLDTIMYTVDYEMEEEVVVGENFIPVYKNVYIHDTISITYGPDPVMDKLSGEIIESFELSDVRLITGEFYKKIIGYHSGISQYSWLPWLADSCWTYTIKDGCFSADEYYKGLGGPYYSCSYGMYISSRELQYYKKGNISWGTPLTITDIKEYNNDTLVKIYPNPAVDILYIQSYLEVEKVSIYDISGRMVKEVYNPQQSITMSDFSKGIYFLRIKTSAGQSLHKIIKQ